MAVTITSHPMVTGVTATLVAGGTLLANTTYYVRITSRTQNSYYWGGVLTSTPSVEISFTTDTVNKSARIDWTAVTGSAGYMVYCSATSGNYYQKKCVSSNNVTTTTNTYTVTSPATYYGLDSFSTFPTTVNIPNGISKELGNILVSFDGTQTLQTIYNAIVAAGYGAYIFYDGIQFYLKGGFYCIGATAGSLSEVSKIVCCFQGGIWNTNPNLSITFGTKDAGGHTTGGCVIFSNLESKVYMQYIKLYHCFVTPLLMPSYLIGWQGTGDICPSSKAGSDSKNILVDQMGFRATGTPNGDVPNNMTLNQAGYAYWNGESINVKLIAGSGYLYIYSAGGVPAFRDWEWDVTNFHHNVLLITTGTKIKNYDCIFKVDGVITTDNLPKVNWAAGYGDQFCDGEFPFEIYNSLIMKITDDTGASLSGATVVLKNKNNTVVLNATTDANGLTTKADIIRTKMDYAGTYNTVSTIESLSPFTLTISKAGYETYVSVFNLTSKIDWIVKLKPIIPIRSTIEGKFLLALLPENGSSSKLLEL